MKLFVPQPTLISVHKRLYLHGITIRLLSCYPSRFSKVLGKRENTVAGKLFPCIVSQYMAKWRNTLRETFTSSVNCVYRIYSNRRPLSNKRFSPINSPSTHKNLINAPLQWTSPFQETHPSKPNGPVCEIVKSLKTCALNLSVDGSEDHFIHCFKEEQLCETGARQLQSQLSVLQEHVRLDPFKVVADSDFEDGDDELFFESDMRWHRNWVKISMLNCGKNFLFLIADSDVESVVNLFMHTIVVQQQITTIELMKEQSKKQK